jgi:hypothetical protein
MQVPPAGSCVHGHIVVPRRASAMVYSRRPQQSFQLFRILTAPQVLPTGLQRLAKIALLDPALQRLDLRAKGE